MVGDARLGRRVSYVCRPSDAEKQKMIEQFLGE